MWYIQYILNILDNKRYVRSFQVNIFFIVSKVGPIKTRLLVSVMIIIGLKNIDFDHHSMSIGRRGKALCARDSIRFS